MAFPADWSSEKKVTIDNTKVSGSANLTNFPVLIKDGNLSSAVYGALNPTTSYSFDTPEANYAYVADNANISITGDMTIECWAKADVISGNGAVVAKDSTSGRAYNFYITPTNVSLIINATNSTVAHNTNAYKWNHYAIVYDASAGNLEVFVNGVSQGSDSGLPTSINDTTVDLRIGNDGFNSGWNGRLSQVRIWSDIRTDAEIADNIYVVKTGTSNNLVGSWFNNDNDYNDDGGTNNLTNSGGSLSTDTEGGSDIRFTSDSAGTTEIPFEIVSLDTSAETSEIWVKVSTVDYNDDTDFYMWYGNSAAVPYASDATYGSENVWSDYGMVQHLGTSLLDATANSNDGTNANTITTTGKIGTAREWDSSSDEITFGTDNSLNLYSAFTFSGWYYPTTPTEDYYRLFDRFLSGSNAGYRVLARSTTGNILVQGNTGGAESAYALTLNAWAKITFILSGTSVKVYENGVLQATITVSFTSNSAYTFYLGGSADASRNFRGKIEQFTATAEVRTVDWDLTEYNNQNSPSTFLTIGDVVITKLLTETIAITDSISKAPARLLTNTISLVDSIIKTPAYKRTYTEAISIVDNIVKFPKKVVSEVIALIDTFIGERTGEKVMVESINITDTVSKIQNRLFSETISIVDSISNQAQKTLSEVITILDIFTKTSTKLLSETISITDTLIKSLLASRIFSETISIVDSISSLSSKIREFTETLTITDSTVKKVNDAIVSLWNRASRATAVTWTRASKAASQVWNRKGRP